MLLMLFTSLKIDATYAYAADVGTITVDGSTTSYGSFTKLRNDLGRLGNKTVTIEMLTDWDAAKDDQFDDTLIIPSNCTATFNMHGHI